jgi:hypothetical protein
MPLFGHRNWIVVADAAYPAQSNPGIETLFTGTDHVEVLSNVLTAIAAAHHVRANIFLDAELQMLTEIDAPGVSIFRREIAQKLSGHATRALAHEQIIARLDEAARLFRIFILKSTHSIPYTSVFLELDCGYWSGEAEKRLRDLQANQTTQTIQSR